MRFLKLLVYGALGYMVYQMFFAEMEEHQEHHRSSHQRGGGSQSGRSGSGAGSGAQRQMSPTGAAR